MRFAALILLISHSAAFAAQHAPAPTTETGVITGHVVLAKHPAAAVTVTLRSRARRDLTTATDERGAYAFRGLTPGEYFVSPFLPGHAILGDVEYQRLRIEVGDPPQQVNFVLAPAGAVEGRVLDAAGEAIAKAPVYLLKLTARDALVPGRVIPVARTDAQGTYRFTEVQPGRYRISAKPHYDPTAPPDARDTRSETEYYYPSGTARASARTLIVTADRLLTGIDIRCGVAARGFVAAGRVVEAASGAAVPNAALIHGAIDRSGAAFVLSRSNVRTGDAGQFTIAGLAPGRYWVGLLNSAFGSGFGRPVFFDVSSSDVQDLELLVDHGVTLTGQVVISGTAISMAGRFTVLFEPRQISLGATPRGDAINAAFSRTARVEPDGHFVLDGVPPGPGRIRLGLEGAEYATRVRQNGLDSQHGEVLAAPGAGQIEILASPGTGSIRGYLRSESGRFNTTGIEVLAVLQEEGAMFTKRVPVNPDGRFLLEDLPPGAYRVMAVARSIAGTESRIGPVVSLLLEPGAAPEIEIDLRRR